MRWPIFTSLVAFLFSFAAQAATPAIGLWRSVDDKSGQPRAIIRIFEENGILHGKVEQILVAADRGRNCTRCTDDRKDQPVLGMEIFRDLHRDGEGWAGHILDPQTGDIYTCTAHLAENGQIFVLRGYIMIELFGRTQTWQRVDKS